MTLFGTAGVRGPVAETVTPELALRVGQAVGADGSSFVVGRDGRVTGPSLAAAMEAGLESAGADVERVGQVPTPALAFASQGRHGVMLTASHNPPADNGIKLFVDGVEYDSDGETRVSERVANGPETVPWDEWGDRRREEVLEPYRRAVASFVRSSVSPGDDEPLSGRTIAVDCGTGMGSLGTPQVLGALGADVRALNANVDGHFPARPSKPTAETLGDFAAFVRDSDVDVAFAHDGDADRIVVLTPDGDVVHEDTVLAILAEHYVDASSGTDPVVVTTPNASARIDERVAEAGGRTERVRLGALHEGIARVRTPVEGKTVASEGGHGKTVASEGVVGDGADGDRVGSDRVESDAVEGETTVAFAAEPWKHIHTAFGGWIDGVTSAGVLAALVAQAGDLRTLREPVTERPYRKVSVPCPDDTKAAAMARLESTLPAAFADGDVDTDYGVRVDLPDGSWVLVRPSGTEPYIRLYAESDAVDDLVDTARESIEQAIESA